MAQVFMDGPAVHWFTILTEVYPKITWEQFEVELLARFSGLEVQNPYEELAGLRQKGSVHDYIVEFETLAVLVPRQPEQQYVGFFLNGLKDDIRSWVRAHNPEYRLKAMQLAWNVEVALRKGGDRSFQGAGPFPRLTQHGPSTSTYSSTTWPPSSGKSRDSGQGILSGNGSEGVSRKSGNNGSRGTHNLTTKEWEERRRKGLCFRCGQQFGPLHKCPDPRLRVMILGEDEEMNKEGKVVMMEGGDGIEEEEEADLSLILSSVGSGLME
ncbi:Retrotransposon gag domain [Sesbania bispinosa]|nr:Retrotransposon gag domain [Sesbania bispinosa]